MLISAVGFSLNKMVCLYSGKTKVAVFEKVNCNPDEEIPASGYNAGCCDFLSEYVQVDFLSYKNPIKAPQPALLLFNQLFFNFRFATEKISIITSIEAPPLPFGINLLKIIAIFRI
jgi:hypothetical protein